MFLIRLTVCRVEADIWDAAKNRAPVYEKILCKVDKQREQKTKVVK